VVGLTARVHPPTLTAVTAVADQGQGQGQGLGLRLCLMGLGLGLGLGLAWGRVAVAAVVAVLTVRGAAGTIVTPRALLGGLVFYTPSVMSGVVGDPVGCLLCATSRCGGVVVRSTLVLAVAPGRVTVTAAGVPAIWAAPGPTICLTPPASAVELQGGAVTGIRSGTGSREPRGTGTRAVTRGGLPLLLWLLLLLRPHLHLPLLHPLLDHHLLLPLSS
jgi:hypothetical protein